jgi:hypothetical protein
MNSIIETDPLRAIGNALERIEMRARQTIELAEDDNARNLIESILYHVEEERKIVKLAIEVLK